MSLGQRAALLKDGDLFKNGVVSHVVSYEESVGDETCCHTKVFLHGGHMHIVGCDDRYGRDGQYVVTKRITVQRAFDERKLNVAEVTVPIDMDELPAEFDPNDYIDPEFDEVLVGLVNNDEWQVVQ